MSVLLDVNVLVALLDPGRIFHDVAHDWFGARRTPWATCPLTENGAVRVISNPRYPNTTGTASTAADLVGGLCGLPGHVFWPDSVSLLDPDVCQIGYLTASGQVTDSYLLALAVASFRPLGYLRHADRDVRGSGGRPGCSRAGCWPHCLADSAARAADRPPTALPTLWGSGRRPTANTASPD